MSARRRSIARALLTVSIVAVPVQIVLEMLILDVRVDVWAFPGAIALMALAPALVGGILALRLPRNPIGWILLAAGSIIAVSGVGGYYGIYVTFGDGAGWPFGWEFAWLGSWPWIVSVFMMAFFVPLLFPTGTLRSPRWRPVAWLGGAWIAAHAAVAAQAGWPPEENLTSTLEPPSSLLGDVMMMGQLLFLALAWTSLIGRYRRASIDERQQLKWLLYAVALLALVAVGPSFERGGPSWFVDVAEGVATILIALIPVSVGIAVVRYRLYEIDIIISRTVVFGALAAFISAVYVAVVIAASVLFRTGFRATLGTSVIATAIVALAFQPIRRRIERFADRVVYGERTSPEDALTELSRCISGAYSADEVLPRMAEILARATTAARGEVWVRVGDTLRRAATHPPQNGTAVSLPLDGTGVPAIAGANRAVGVRHGGELLGALSVAMRPGEPMTAATDSLLEDLAAQAGIVLRNVRLTAELAARVEQVAAQAQELRASRQRIVAAQDAERRSLERNIHDGAQQYLVALAVKVRLAKTMTARDPSQVRRLIEELRNTTAETIAALRDLARGIYPPLLVERGVVAALRAHAERSPVRVSVEDGGVGRHTPEIEAAVYFACLEALQNAMKYARASLVSVKLWHENGELVFEVADDGVGFDPEQVAQGSGLQNMRDRLSTVGGELDVHSAPRAGTTITGRVPTKVPEEAHV